MGSTKVTGERPTGVFCATAGREGKREVADGNGLSRCGLVGNVSVGRSNRWYLSGYIFLGVWVDTSQMCVQRRCWIPQSYYPK